MSLYMLEAEVNNGGVSQYFFNSSGDQAATALRGLREIGATRTEAMLRDAMQVFGRNGPSPDRQTRIRQLEKLSSKAEDQLDSFNRALFEDPDHLVVKLSLYVAAHSESFKD